MRYSRKGPKTMRKLLLALVSALLITFGLWS